MDMIGPLFVSDLLHRNCRMQILSWRADAPAKSLPQAAELPVQGKVDFPENACIVPGKTVEVVLLIESTQTIDTTGGPTSSGASRHLPLNRSLWSLGKAFGCLISPTNPNLPD